LPNCPYSFKPQQRTVWVAVTTHVVPPPAEIDVAVVIPVTRIGARLFAPEPFAYGAPQHLTVWSAKSAHVWLSPVATATAVEIPGTTTGDRRLTVVPSPT
jgi:hypothetical protein